ncbi:MAG: dethiobiotin synthase [Betaproteobacteria bacterium]|nr:dethiobiotin synthase [Betaproteobacteria bacterium]
MLDQTPTSRGFFITGTDTGVGKTLVACALLYAFAARGLRAIGMKPVAAGASLENGALVNDDVAALVAASGVRAPRELQNPYCFAPPIAPHIAAAQAGVAIDIGHVKAAYVNLAARADVVIVEGAGGFRVPLGDGLDMSDLARLLGLPVVLVVGVRLGCLNHALLTADAIDAAGLPFAGWVANHIDPDMTHATENVQALEARLRAPLLSRIRYAEGVCAASVASSFDVAALLRDGRVADE